MEINLFDLLADRGELTEDQSKHVIKQIIDGVEELHKVNICHRDLKVFHQSLFHNWIIYIYSLFLSLFVTSNI